MKKANYLLLALGLAATSSFTAMAETVAPYTVDFNTPIATVSPDFRVASNWRHIVDSYESYGRSYYVDYYYDAENGVDQSGCLRAGSQVIGDPYDYDDQLAVNDLLVTPMISGELTFAAQLTNYAGYVTLYAINDDGSRGSQLNRFSSSELSQSEWRVMTVALEKPMRVGFKLSQARLDNLTATSADITVEKSITVESALPNDCDYTGNGATGTIYWYQQPEGPVKVSYMVTVTNNGEADIALGEENFTVSIINRKNKEAFVTVPVPQALAIGETSEPFEVTAMVPATNWTSSYSYLNMDVRENLQGSSLNRAQSNYRAYEPKFVLREAGSTTTSSLSSAIAFGMVKEATTKSFEIYNDGAAPMTIKSVTLPEGFTTDLEQTSNFVLAKKTGVPFNVTLTTDALGTFSGDITIVYLDKNGEDVTKTLPVSGTVLGANTWFTTFDNPDGTSTVAFPAGSVAESGIQSDYTYSSSTKVYDIFLKSYTASSYKDENNKFITPKLRAAAGDKLSFDVARDGTNATYFMNVYLSTDRVNWGEPVATFTPSDMGGSAFENRSITIAEAGDYYVAFAIFGMRLNNVAGLEKVPVDRDIYIKNVRQDEKVQGGKEVSSTLVIVPLSDADSFEYTVGFFADGEQVATVAPISLTASANRETQFVAKWTPEVTATTTFSTHFEVTFTDGTKFVSQPKDLTIEYQAEFVFFNRDGYANPNYKPDNRKEAIRFGKVNETGLTQSFDIYNWGAAPLTVKSVTVPEGFTAVYPVAEGEPQPAGETTVAAKERQPLDIVLSATEAGTYSGNMEVTFLNNEGRDSVFSLPISVVMLDPSKWYASFDDGTTNGAWPAGSVHESGVSLYNSGTYAAPDMAIYGYNTSNNLFVTPKLTAAAGEALTFDSKLYGSYSSSGSIKVYAAATRAELFDTENRTAVAEFSIDSEDPDKKIGADYKTFSVTFPEAGDYYVGFASTDRAMINDIYGLSLAPAAHDLELAATLIPASAMQNVTKIANLAVRNFGLKAEEAGSYTLTAYVNGVAQTIEGDKVIPTVDTPTAATTSFEVPFRSPKAGTFPVYLEFKAGDFVLTSEPQDVVFAEETLASEIVVGTPSGTSARIPVNLYYKDSESILLYTQNDLGMSGGEKISKIAIRGLMKKEYTSNFKFYYQWTDDTELTRPESSGAFPYEDLGMTQVIDQEGYEWHAAGSESDLAEMFVINFPEPAVYQAGKSLRLFFRSNASKDAGNNQLLIEQSNIKKNCFNHQDDGTWNEFTGAWTAANEQALPVLRISLVAEPISLSGSVTDTEGNAAEGATVTLVSTDGDNIQYEGTTDATGAYTVNVIQSSRVYDVLVTKDGKEDYADAVEFPESKTNDFTLYTVANLNDATEGVTAIESALVKIDLGLKPGFNAIALPVALTTDEVTALFGEDAKVYEFVSVDGEIDALAHFYAKTDGMDAGVPYLLEIAEEPAPIKVKGRAVVTDTPSVAHYAVDFTATYAPVAVTEGMFFLTADNYEATTAAATHGVSFMADETAETLPAFRAYVKQREGRELQSLRFDILTEYTGIENVAAEYGEDAEIYNLQGIRVKNPSAAGVYIVNGRKVLVK
ncbi:MAG: carboxypeptidase regulatory-like domain-containing protein [[Clostridium] fimetarium]|nr:carboxypeptidase regulatory-like domain-containing protein [Alistipes timonensis]MCM1405300.1 carboxypeptidase regulatory-like domain-containing protein [[Clostridium] fimetarium]